MKVVVAIDSLKGSLSSLEAGDAIREGILAGGGAGLLHSVKNVLKNHKKLYNLLLYIFETLVLFEE